MMAYLSNKISRLFKKIFHFVYNTSTLCFLSESIFSVSLKGDKTTIYLFNRLFISVCKDNVTSSTEFKSVFNSSARQNHNHLLIQLNKLSLVCSNKREKYSVFSSDVQSLQSISRKISHYKSSHPHNLTAKICLWPRLYFFMLSVSLPTLRP